MKRLFPRLNGEQPFASVVMIPIGYRFFIFFTVSVVNHLIIIKRTKWGIPSG